MYLPLYVAVCYIVALWLTSTEEYRRQARENGKDTRRARWWVVAKAPFVLPFAIGSVILKMPAMIARAWKDSKED